MSHQHKLSIDDEFNNRYQANAPFLVWCKRCKTLIPATPEFVDQIIGDERRARDKAKSQWPSDDSLEKSRTIMLRKIDQWKDRRVSINRVGQDALGRLMIEFVET